jgi:FtsH-binding integral membrane protein
MKKVAKMWWRGFLAMFLTWLMMVMMFLPLAVCDFLGRKGTWHYWSWCATGEAESIAYLVCSVYSPLISYWLWKVILVQARFGSRVINGTLTDDGI